MPVPKGYTLLPAMSTAPAFLREGVDMSRVKQGVVAPKPEERGALAAVRSDQPYSIDVFHPELYKAADRDHELTHVFQDTRNAKIHPYATTNGLGNDSYDYGGVEGLEKARAGRKTVADFNAEQQAAMVKDYKTQHDHYLALAKAKKMTPQDAKAMYRLQQAYHPFISQLAAMPGQNDQMKTINANPQAPGLPSPAVAGMGMIAADPLLGGESQAYRPRK